MSSDRATDILPQPNPWGFRSQTGQSTARGSPLAVGGVVGCASTAPDRDNGLRLPPRRRTYPYLRLDTTTNAKNISVFSTVGLIPRLKSWAFASYYFDLLPPRRVGFPRHGTAWVGVSGSQPGRMTRLLAGPSRRYSYPILGVRVTFCPEPTASGSKGVLSNVAWAESDIIRFVGRLNRLSLIIRTDSMCIKLPLAETEIRSQVVGFIPPVNGWAFSLSLL